MPDGCAPSSTLSQGRESWRARRRYRPIGGRVDGAILRSSWSMRRAALRSTYRAILRLLVELLLVDLIA
jgi:hypothetical protein